MDETWFVGIVGSGGDLLMLGVLFQVVNEVEIVHGDVIVEGCIHVVVFMKVFDS
jgi:hypothetical protein